MLASFKGKRRHRDVQSDAAEAAITAAKLSLN